MTRRAICAALAVAVPLVNPSPAQDKEQRNRAIIREHVDRINREGPKAAAEGFAEGLTHQGHPVTRESRVRVLEDIFNTFPDYHSEILEMVAEGDSVVVRSRVSGTHRGVGKLAVNGGMLVGVPPTQKRFEVETIHWYKLRDGKIVEHYAGRDDVGMMRQLGLVPEIGLPITK